ncbi:MAG: WG repeat-containing protein [Crocinitomicaceae bacterium]
MKVFYLFLFVILGIAPNAHAQDDLQLIAFTNYGSCYQGLKTEKGNIIWPADFESLEKITDYEYVPTNPYHYMMRYYWIAEKNGYFGLINPDGEQILPFRFNKIKSAYPLRTGVIASDDSASYLFSNNGELKLKLDGSSWFEITPKGYIFEKNGQFGFLDEELREILPVEYDQLTFEIIQHSSEGIREVVSNRFIRTRKDLQTSIFDLTQDKWVVSKTNDLIEAIWVTHCSESDALFHLTNEHHTNFVVLKSDGKVASSGSKSIANDIILTSIDSCGTRSHQLAYFENEESMKVADLKRNNLSQEFPLIYPLDGYSVFFEKKKWGVLDPYLNELGRFKYPKSVKKYAPRKELSKRNQAEDKFYLYFAEGYHEYFSQTGLLTDSVLVTYEYSEENQHNYGSEQWGLFNFRTGKTTKKKYNGLGRYEYKGSTIYWCNEGVSHGEMGYETMKIDIYNSELERINEFSGKIYLERVSSRSDRGHQVIILNEKMGVINPFGEELIPIEYDECRRMEVRSINHKKRDVLFVVRKNGESPRIFDYNGKILINENHTRFESKGQYLMAYRKDGLKDVYDSKGNLLLKGFKHQRNSTRIDKFGKCIGFDNKDGLIPNACTYFTKDDKLIEFRGGKMYELDENFFQFEANYCYFLEWIIINKAGKIVTTDPKGVSKLSMDYRREYPNECSTYLNEYPIPEKQKRKTKPQKQKPSTPRKKQYIWKQHNRNNPNEWFLYNGNDVLMYPESFEYPLPEESFYGGVFMQNGKYGYFDSKYNQYLEAEYDYIFPPAPITLKNGSWQIHHRNSGKVSPEFDQISLDYRNYLHFVFKDGKIGVINDSMEFIIPLTDSVDLVTNYDLVKLLSLKGYTGQTRMHIVNNLVYNGKPSKVYRKINNIHILEQVTLNSTENNLLKFSPIDLNRADIPTGFRDKVMYYNINQTIRERRPKYANRYFYSEMTLTWTRNWKDQRWGLLIREEFKYKEFFNYKIVGDKLVPIDINDLFKSDEKSVAKLNALLIEKLTKIQAFGENCTDINDKVEQLKQKFIIHNGRELVFYWQNAGGFIISLNITEIEDLLLEPQKFKEKS